MSAPALRRRPSTWCYRLIPVLGLLLRGDRAEAQGHLATLREVAEAELAELEAMGIDEDGPEEVAPPGWRVVDREAPAALARAGALLAAGALQEAVLELEALAMVRRPDEVVQRYDDLREDPQERLLP